MSDATGETVTVAEQAAENATGRLPDFIIIGAMKAGTTSLYELIDRHPNVYLCPEKEPMFFSRDHVRVRGLDWYKSLFAAAREGQRCGEASTCYSRHPHFGDVPGRIHAVMPDVKLIYIMRHPVERAYSHYGHEMRFEVTATFEEALQRDRSIIDASLYIRQIEQYLQQFPREQILLLTLDDFEVDPAAVMDSVQAFLGLERIDLMRNGVVRANEARLRTARWTLRRQWKSVRQWPVFRQIVDVCPGPMRRGMYRFLLERSVDSPIGRRIADGHRAKLSPLTPRVRADLLGVFNPATRELESLLGRTLPAWFT